VEVDGATVTPDQVVGPPRPGRRVVYTGDTAPSRAVVRASRDADLLVHDGTFGEEEEERARATFHTTAAQAAGVGRDAGVRRLVLTHLSARYADQPGVLVEQARAVFPEAMVARDGMEIEIPYTDDGAR
jgi:ribonuclease Z